MHRRARPRTRIRIRIRSAALVIALAAGMVTGGVLIAGPASAHEERQAIFPTGKGHWIQHPRAYDAKRPHLVVCQPDSASRIARIKNAAVRQHNQALLPQCRFHSIQEAVNAVKQRGTDIWMLPGLYTEAQYDGAPSGVCSQLQAAPATDFIGTLTDPTGKPAYEDGTPVALSYKDQLRCPHNLNLVAILGDHTPKDSADQDTPESIACDTALCGIQLAGTGASPYDVVLDNRFSKLNAIRADRVDGVIFSNFTVQRSEFNSLYIMESDGFLIDHVIARANEEYGFLTFASDHGIYQHTETYFNGDSGIYPGAASDVNGNNLNFPVKRYAVEVRYNDSHDNTLGYSGTAGNSVWVHDNVFHHNGTGLVTDSLFPNHPGLPQDHARFGPNNRFFSNNQNYFETNVFGDDPPCAKPIEQRGYLEHGVVCPSTLAPVGSGLAIAGGNFDSIDHNKIYDNWRYGTLLLWVPAALRNETDPGLTYDTSNNNHTVGNRLAENPLGRLLQPNGVDFFWDEEGSGNCWKGNTSLAGEPTTNAILPTGLPSTCTDTGQGINYKGHLVSTNPGTAAFQDPGFVTCTQYAGVSTDPVTQQTCEWFHDPAQPSGRKGPAYDHTPYKAPYVDALHVAPLHPTVTTANKAAPVGVDVPSEGPGLAATGGGLGLALLGLGALGAAAWLRRRRIA